MQICFKTADVFCMDSTLVLEMQSTHLQDLVIFPRKHFPAILRNFATLREQPKRQNLKM